MLVKNNYSGVERRAKVRYSGVERRATRRCGHSEITPVLLKKLGLRK